MVNQSLFKWAAVVGVTRYQRLVVVGVMILLGCQQSYAVPRKIACPDGDHYEIDVAQIAIQYDGHAFAATLNSLGVLAGRLSLSSNQLQQAAAATQQWDEFVKGLAVGYNSCAVTRQQYVEGIERIYPRLKEDAQQLEQMRALLSESHKIDERRLGQLVADYFENLKKLASISGKLDLIFAISSRTEQNTQDILKSVNELKEALQQARLPSPMQVQTELRTKLLARADEAETAYNTAYHLLSAYRFSDAIPQFQRALTIIKLPEFYIGLAIAYSGVPVLDKAEATVREGLHEIADKQDERGQADLDNQMGRVLLLQGKWSEALPYMQHASELDKKLYGLTNNNYLARDLSNISAVFAYQGRNSEALNFAQSALATQNSEAPGADPQNVAVIENNIGEILKGQNDLDGALVHLKTALVLTERACGPRSRNAASVQNNIGQVLNEKGQLDEALEYLTRAREIDEAALGPDHPDVARDLNNTAAVLLKMHIRKTQQDDKSSSPSQGAPVDDLLIGAREADERSLRIFENAYGPYHPDVGKAAGTLAYVFQAFGDTERALGYFERSEKIFEKVGESKEQLAASCREIGFILQQQGKLTEALPYLLKGLRISEEIYPAPSHDVALFENKISMVLFDLNRVEESVGYAESALKIEEQIFGLESVGAGTMASNFALILFKRNDFKRALAIATRAEEIFQKNFGSDDSRTKGAAKIVSASRQALGKN